jgi:hypothetical protein
VGKHPRFIEQYFELLAAYCDFGPEYRNHLIQLNVIEKIVEIAVNNPPWRAGDVTRPTPTRQLPRSATTLPNAVTPCRTHEVRCDAHRRTLDAR